MKTTTPSAPVHYKVSDNSETWNEAARQVRETMQPAIDILKSATAPLPQVDK